jgi:hypothetical protein
VKQNPEAMSVSGIFPPMGPRQAGMGNERLVEVRNENESVGAFTVVDD